MVSPLAVPAGPACRWFLRLALPPRHFQTEPFCRPGRVVSAGGLNALRPAPFAGPRSGLSDNASAMGIALSNICGTTRCISVVLLTRRLVHPANAPTDGLRPLGGLARRYRHRDTEIREQSRARSCPDRDLRGNR